MPKPKTSRIASYLAIALAASPLLGAVMYFFLGTLHQHAYGLLDVRPAEVGLDRGRLIDETVAGTLVLIVGLPLFILLLTSVLVLLVEHIAPPLLRGFLGRLPVDPNSRLAKRNRTRRQPALRGSVLLPFVAIVGALGTTFVLFVMVWSAGSAAAHAIRDGSGFKGAFAAGLNFLDIQPLGFRFTRLPAHHDFDRGCVVYLGHAEGRLVLYDTLGQRPLRLPEHDYEGEALAPLASLPARCHRVTRARDETVLVDGPQIEHVDAVRSTVVWSQHSPRSGQWQLLRWTLDQGHINVLGTSSAPMQPDLGRDPQGRLELTYRTCRAGHCALRERVDAGGRPRPISVPRIQGCSAGWPTRHTNVFAILFQGPRCSSASRGIWLRSRSGRWRRIAGTSTAVGELDAFGHRLAWLDRQGPLQRIRVLTDDTAPSTIFTNSVALGGMPSEIRSIHVVRGGIAWALSFDATGRTEIFSIATGADGCEIHKEFGDRTYGLRDFGLLGPWTIAASPTTLRIIRRSVQIGDGPVAGVWVNAVLGRVTCGS